MLSPGILSQMKNSENSGVSPKQRPSDEFFEVSWNTPHKYFDKISSIDRSKVMPCAKTRLAVSENMKTYVPWRMFRAKFLKRFFFASEKTCTQLCQTLLKVVCKKFSEAADFRRIQYAIRWRSQEIWMEWW